jgi:hypothetical protein
MQLFWPQEQPLATVGPLQCHGVPSRFGGYCYCVADQDGPAFSNYSHDSEDEAILSVWHYVGDI